MTLPAKLEPVLEGLDWSPFFDEQLRLWLEAPGGLVSAQPFRIAVDRGVEYGLMGAEGSHRAVLAGRLMRELVGERRPCIGDFVMASSMDHGELVRIEHVFARKSVFRRKVAGSSSEGQAIAANVDLAIVVCALAAEDSDPHAQSHGLNPRRIERYLQALRAAKVDPLVLVNKVDLHVLAQEQTDSLSRALGNAADVLPVSTKTGAGMERLGKYLPRGVTAVLVGSSGVGKSSLTNALIGSSTQRVQEVRDTDTRGRHTTTHRELFTLPSGGMLIDTPGMREFGLFAEEEGPPTGTGFEDIDAFASQCRYGDCAHVNEPGCAVIAAVQRGELPAARLEHAQHLLRELSVQQLRHDALKRHTEKLRTKVLTKGVRTRTRMKERGQ